MSGIGEPAAVAAGQPRFIEWSAVFGGAVVAAGITFALVAFGAAIGLSVASASPTWRDSSPLLWFLSGLFLVFVALCSFGFGGYVAGRMRVPVLVGDADERRFRDGIHGVIMWGLALIVGAVLAIAGASALAPAATSNSSRAGAATSVAGENMIASELDELFRSDRRAINVDDLTYRRAEAARILLKTSGHQGVTADDRLYLSDMVSTQTGLGDADAQARVNHVIDEATQDIHKARQAAVLQAFLVAAALFLGAAVAWFAACEGGQDRDKNKVYRPGWLPRRRALS